MAKIFKEMDPERFSIDEVLDYFNENYRGESSKKKSKKKKKKSKK